MIFYNAKVLCWALLGSFTINEQAFCRHVVGFAPKAAGECIVTESTSSDDTLFSEWQNLSRPTIRNPFCSFYRFGFHNGNYFLDLKASVGGVKFIVARNALLEIEMECGDMVTLFNTKYEKSCRGCGAVWNESDVHGVTLRFPMTASDLEILAHDYPAHIRLHLPDNTAGSYFTVRRTELFRGEVDRFKERVRSL